jgi:hypothetical protein
VVIRLSFGQRRGHGALHVARWLVK